MSLSPLNARCLINPEALTQDAGLRSFAVLILGVLDAVAEGSLSLTEARELSFNEEIATRLARRFSSDSAQAFADAVRRLPSLNTAEVQLKGTRIWTCRSGLTRR